MSHGDIRSVALLDRTLRYRAVTVQTPDGIAVSAQDWAPDGRSPGGRDVLLVHGFSQSHLCWLRQFTGPLAGAHRIATWDLRGHGGSDKPVGPAWYREPSRWAGEVASVIAQAGLQRPVLVAWSYGGRVALDYLAAHGDGGISGLVLAGATSTVAPEVRGPDARVMEPMACAPDLASNLAATGQFLRSSKAAPLDEEAYALMLAYNMAVPVHVRAALVGRPADYDATLRGLRVPVLSIHGREDRINLPEVTAHVASLCLHARTLIYDECGHMPFWEQADRFDADLGEFLTGLRP